MIYSTLARSQYDAGVISISKRATGWWGGRISYTYSRLYDNQFGQGNYYSSSPGILNNFTADPESAYFNPDAEYGRSLLDSPHKLVASPIIRLPFGQGQRWLTERRRQRDRRRLDGVVRHPDAERLPDGRHPEHQQHQPARPRPASERGAGSRDPDRRQHHRSPPRQSGRQSVPEPGGVHASAAGNDRQRAALLRRRVFTVAQLDRHGAEQGRLASAAAAGCRCAST